MRIIISKGLLQERQIYNYVRWTKVQINCSNLSPLTYINMIKCMQ